MAAISQLRFDKVLTDADQNIDALMNVYSGSNSSYWADTTITFSFPDSRLDFGYTPDPGTSFFSPMNTAQKTAIRAVLEHYESVSGLTFTELGSGSANGTLRFMEGTNIEAAFAYLPDSTEAGGDVWLNSVDYNAPVVGDYAHITLLHEIGHALGLKHGHETEGPGKMTANRDSMEFSVMTYSSYIGQDLDAEPYFTNAEDSFAQSLMMYDIAAIQRYYGANFTTNSDDTRYTFSTTTGEMSLNGVGQGTPAGNVVFRTIWDGGGVDTYDFSNYATSLDIDLVPGSFTDLDTVGDAQRAELNQFSNASTSHARGHVFNALQYEADTRSLIENATGGSGDDVISGNFVGNVLLGNGGNDILSGDAGNDTLIGGAGADRMFGGDGNDTIVFDWADIQADVQGGQGTDLLIVESANVPTDFNLQAHGFEAVEQRATGGAGDSFATMTGAYDLNWNHISTITANKDGTSQWLLSDQAGQQAWTTVRYDFDATSALKFSAFQMDDASSFWITQDVANEQTWQEVRYEFNPGGLLTFTSYVLDSGAAYWITQDVADQQNWQEVRYEFNGQGDLTFTSYVLDGGAAYWINQDVADTETWSELRYEFDDTGTLDFTSFAWDDSTALWINADPHDFEIWSEQRREFDSANRVTHFQQTMDDNSRQSTVYDAADQQAWSEWHRSYDAAGTLTDEFFV